MKRTIMIAVTAAILWPATSALASLRGWHTDGQTFLVWTRVFPGPETYDVYVSRAPIDDLAGAELIGRVFPQEFLPERVRLADQAAPWQLPDGEGGRYRLQLTEGYFVYTPHEAVPEFFAVVPHGGALDLADVAGPIQQTTDPVQCHLQTEIDSIWGIPLRIYAHWIDGRDDEDSGRPDYPVMGNAGANGTAHVFLIQEPHGGRTGDKLPAVFTLHGSGMGSYTSWTTPAVNLLFDLDGRLDGAFLVGLDDVLMMNTVGQLGEPPFPHMVQTRWLGYWRGYDRFTPPTEPPPDDAVVINYTIRRVDFLIDWILAHEEVDEHRLSLVGISGGGGGVGFMARWAPEKFAAGISFVPPLIGSPFDEATYLMGSFDQNLATNLPGGIGVRDWYRLSTRIRDEDTPFLRFVIGTQDSFGTWPEQIEFWNEFDAMRFGAHLYWDGRGHISDWRPQHWTGSEKHQPRSLTRFRNDQSFPAFSAADERPDLDSRMPDPLIDPWGTWGGYLDWETETIKDTADEWAATIFLTSTSPFASDVPDFDKQKTDLSIRRPRRFKPEPGAVLLWKAVPVGGEFADQEGELTVDEDGLATIENLFVGKTPLRVTIWAPVTAPDDDDSAGLDKNADDDAGDDDDDDGGCGCGL